MSELPLCSGLPRSLSLPSEAPPLRPWRPVPSTAQRLRSAGAARQGQAAPSVAPVQDPLGEASWAPELDGDLENFYIYFRVCKYTNQHSVSSSGFVNTPINTVSSSRFVNTPIGTLYLANLVETWKTSPL
uniref:Uncharacterized protein n=1 Tax=Macaca fascicularis TaxID=9541 RepID=A0A7N9CKD9_MACFA